MKIVTFSIPAAPGQLGHSKSLLFKRILTKNRYVFSIPAAPGQPGQSKSLLFERILITSRYFFPSPPLPASPGNQNCYFSKRILQRVALIHLNPGLFTTLRFISTKGFNSPQPALIHHTYRVNIWNSYCSN